MPAALALTATFVLAMHAQAQATLVDDSAKSAGKTTEVLVGVTSTAMPAAPLFGRRAVELQNDGPATIYCAVGGAAVVGHSRAVAAGASWNVDLGDGVPLACIAAVAQVSGAATIVTEVR